MRSGRHGPARVGRTRGPPVAAADARGRAAPGGRPGARRPARRSSRPAMGSTSGATSWARVDALDRDRLADLPGQPPPGAPLVCLDTETTGLATAAGTLAFLVGLAWWEDGAAARRAAPAARPRRRAGAARRTRRRTARRMAGSSPTTGVRSTGRCSSRATGSRDARPPEVAGHLDLLWHVRGLFRHRLEDARLQTVERELLGIRANGRRAGLGDPRAVPRLPPDGPAGRPGRGGAPQRDGRRLAGRAARPHRHAARGPSRAAQRPAGDLAAWPGVSARGPSDRRARLL